MPSTYEARLPSNERKMVLVTNPPGMAYRQFSRAGIGFFTSLLRGRLFLLLNEALKAFGEQRTKDFSVMLALVVFQVRQRLADVSYRSLISFPKCGGCLVVVDAIQLSAYGGTVFNGVDVFGENFACRRYQYPGNRRLMCAPLAL